jgi:hypothetical protein
MKHHRFCLFGALLAIAVLLPSCLAGTVPDAAPNVPHVQPSAHSGNMPLYFEPNQGQTDPRVRFIARNQGISVFLEDREASLVLGSHGPDGGPSVVVRMRLLGASSPKTVSGLERMQGIANYFRGKDPAKWRTNIPLYARVRYEQVYKGVDLVYYGNGGRLEYDFVVAPGADPKSIVLGLEGADRLRLDASGELVVETQAGELRLKKPVAYQYSAGERRPVEASFALSAPDRVGFSLGAFDRSQPLVIDPVLVYSTLLGGSQTDVGASIAVDSAGNAFVAGYTRSVDFPAFGGAPLAHPSSSNDEVIVVKLNASGTDVLYSTCLGGAASDQAYSLAIDADGNAFIAGTTSSTDFPVVNAAQGTYGGGSSDGFVLKLNPQGNTLLYSTYLGGSGFDYVNGIALDQVSGAAYVAGTTGSSNLVTTPGAYQAAKAGSDDGFVVKLDSTGVRAAATYLGGSAQDAAEAIAVDPSTDPSASRSPYVTGWTISNPFPTTAGVLKTTLTGYKDVFVTKLNADLTGLVYSTYFGVSGEEQGFGIAVDSSGNAYVAGDTSSWDLPTTAGVVQPIYGYSNTQPFVFKLSPDGKNLLYCTYLGGKYGGQAYGIAVDGSEKAYITGRTASEDFPSASAVQVAQPSLRTGGMVRTADGGATFDSLDHEIAPQNPSLAIAVDPSDTRILLVGSSGINRSTDAGEHWTHTDVWDYTTSFGRSPSNSSIIYAGANNGVRKSTDSGLTWSSRGLNPGMSGRNTLGLAVDPATPSTVYAAMGTGGLWVSTDSGSTWTKIDGGLGSLAINDVLIDPTNANVMYTATSTGVYKSGNGGTTWVANNNGLPPGNALGSNHPLLMDQSSTATLYARIGNTIYKTTDGGGNWATAKAFDPEPLLNAALSPSNPSVLYAITRFGVYRSANAGTDWSITLGGIEVYNVPIVVVDPGNDLVAYLGSSIPYDAFAVKLDSTATAYVYSTFLGGSGGDAGNAIAADSSGNAYVTGSMGSTEFPTTSGAYAQVTTGTGAFVTKISDSTPACSYVVKPGARPNSARTAFGSAAGWTDFVVIAPSGCDWQAVSNDSWISVAGEVMDGGRGPGTGSFTILVDANSGASREGTVSVAGQTLTFSQAGLGCTFRLLNLAQPITAAGGTISVSVIGGDGCLWGVDNAFDWVTSDTVSKTGLGTVTLTVGANASALPRIARVFIGPSGFVVSQAGTGASFSFTPPSLNLDRHATGGSITVTSSPTGLSWQPWSSQPWLRVSFATPTSLSYMIDENKSGRIRTAKIVIGGDVLTVTQTPDGPSIGTYNAGLWTLDTNGNAAYDPGVDMRFNWGWSETTPVLGDWNGDGKKEVGFFKDGLWYLDMNGNGTWEGEATEMYAFGMPGVEPKVGDWNGDGKDEIGIYIDGFWFLDMNGNGVWDGAPTDKMIIWGFVGSTPVTGDWNGDGRTKVGLYKDGLWYLDVDGNGIWDGGTTDRMIAWGWTGTTPVHGDWNGDGMEELGVYIDGFWFLDMDGNGAWDGGTTDKMIILGWSGTTPLTGDWNSDGKVEVGIFINGYWFADVNGNGVWDGAPPDAEVVFGGSGDTPLVGKW